MELQKLRYFHTVAKFQHMTRAAESICIAQPALTQAIKSLERELGVPLFEKRGRNIVLTEYGKYLKERLDAILPELDRVPLELEQMRCRATKTVRLNILAASSFVIAAIVGYRKEHPDAIFEFEQNERRDDCDIAIATNGFDGRMLDSREGGCSERAVRSERIYLAVPRDSVYASRSSVALASVQNEGFVMLSSSRLFGAICNRLCLSAGFYPKILFESDSPTAVQNIISTGTGVAFWPEYSWGALRNENVVLLPISSPDCRRELIVERYERPLRSEYAEDFYRYLLRQIDEA